MPIVVLNALVFFGTVWGIAGMVLAVPFLVIVKLVLEQVNHPSAQYVFRMLRASLITMTKRMTETAR